jgi:hypothetical protein
VHENPRGYDQVRETTWLRAEAGSLIGLQEAFPGPVPGDNLSRGIVFMS